VEGEGAEAFFHGVEALAGKIEEVAVSFGVVEVEEFGMFVGFGHDDSDSTVQAIWVGTAADSASVVAMIELIGLRIRDINPARAMAIGAIGIAPPSTLVGICWLGQVLPNDGDSRTELAMVIGNRGLDSLGEAG
jgi:hypothetical protein